jgi:hypothetical protein
MLAAAAEDALTSESSSTPLVIDPAIFVPGRREGEGQDFERLLRVAEEVAGSPRVLVPIHAVERQIGSTGFDGDDWTDQHGPDALHALNPLLERILAEPTPRSSDVLDLRPERGPAAAASDRELRDMISGLLDRCAGSLGEWL